MSKILTKEYHTIFEQYFQSLGELVSHHGKVATTTLRFRKCSEGYFLPKETGDDLVIYRNFSAFHCQMEVPEKWKNCNRTQTHNQLQQLLNEHPTIWSKLCTLFETGYGNNTESETKMSQWTVKLGYFGLLGTSIFMKTSSFRVS